MHNNIRMDVYEDLPSGMKEYLSNYGWHFSKKMCEFAVSRMKKDDANGKEVNITPYTNEEVHQLLKQYGVQLKNDVGYDACYLANMINADYLGKSIPNEQYMCQHINCFLDDVDGSPTKAFDHYYSDTIANGIPLIWEDMM